MKIQTDKYLSGMNCNGTAMPPPVECSGQEGGLRGTRKTKAIVQPMLSAIL
jgi:hypothetical protein